MEYFGLFRQQVLCYSASDGMIRRLLVLKIIFIPRCHKEPQKRGGMKRAPERQRATIFADNDFEMVTNEKGVIKGAGEAS